MGGGQGLGKTLGGVMSNALMIKPMNLPVAVDSLELYIRQVNAIPLLSYDEERELACRLKLQNDLEAAQQLIMAHLRFVVRIARSYMGYGLPLNDLIQEGNIGLMEAVKRFDPDHGVRLVSFAVHWIRAKIQEFILRNWRIVKVATTKAQRKLFFNLRSAKKHLGWLTPDEVDAMAKDLGVSADDVTQMESRLSGYDVSFDPDPEDDGHEDNSALAPVMYLSDSRYDPFTQLSQDDWDDQARHQLADALEHLDARSRDIVQRRWLSEKKATLQELAHDYGVSAERIRQLENNAIKSLKAVMVA